MGVPHPSSPTTMLYSLSSREPMMDDSMVDSPDERIARITAPLGFWHNITDPMVRATEIQREINNRNNFFIMPGSMTFTLDNTAKTKWSVKKEWGDELENKPYEYMGSKFAGDRLIKAIYLREAHNQGDVTHTLTFALLNKGMEFNMLAPIRKFLSPSNMHGPVHASLEPGEKIMGPSPLWVKNYAIPRSQVIQDNPEKTRKDLKDSLKTCHADPLNKFVLLPHDVLCEYIREQTEGTEFKTDLDWIPGANHYEINRDIATLHMDNWVSEQCLDLTINKLWNISVIPGTVESEEQLKRKVPVHYLGDEAGVNDYIKKMAAGVPQTISFEIQVELEPISMRS
jgi:hypothetical protein